MDFNEPIAGEFDDADELVSAAEALMEQMRQMNALLQQQLQLTAMLAQQLQAMNGPKRVVRDQGGRVIGVEPVQ